jgi:prepilin-type N-terminal cleavage/methylation domain-containing protein
MEVKMKEVKGQKGFTLIELAIVVVIIGIILGAVFKGQDLIESARHDKLAAEIRQWENLTWVYMDRRGMFPGDANRDGTIGDSSVQADFAASGLTYAPTTNTISLGGTTFHLFLGNHGVRRNAVVVCLTHNCAGAGSTFAAIADLEYARSFDLAIDGAESGTAGRVRSVNVVASANSATWLATVTAGFTAWTSSTVAILYFFDRLP